MSQPPMQVDPLNSPHPVPWNWVQATLNATDTNLQSLHFYRSPALLSPNGQYSAYSRIQIRRHPDFFRSQVSSVLFLENLTGGDLQVIMPSSPLAENPFFNWDTEQEGRISMIIPISWSETGDRLLAREFESLFASDIASDYAVVVNSQTREVRTISPNQITYTNAVLLGWSQTYPDRVLFLAGELGDSNWQHWTVSLDGRTEVCTGDQPQVWGQTISHVWMGPQSQS